VPACRAPVRDKHVMGRMRYCFMLKKQPYIICGRGCQQKRHLLSAFVYWGYQ
jgi:hypothetical protein